MLPQLMGQEVDPHVQAVLDVMPGPSRSTSSWWNSGRDLETLLKKFGRSESSNPRDAIYALLGISSNFKDNRVLTPDYDITFEEAVQNTIWALLFGEVLDRSLYKLPTWDKTQFMGTLQDLPGSVFDWAISEREMPVLLRLLTSGSVPDGVQVSGSIQGSLHHYLPLHTLIQNDLPLSAIQAFMPHADLEINRKSDVRGGYGPLHLAAARGLDSVVDVLLQHPKVDVNLEGNGSIVKSITQASPYYSNLAIADTDSEVCDTNREVYGIDTPLNIAVVRGRPSVVKVLLDYCNNGVRVQVKTAGGTALHLAAAVLKGYPEDAKVVELLLQHEDVDINGLNWEGMSPLNIAVIQQNNHLTKLLLQHEGIDVNHVGWGYSPLAYAVKARLTYIISILIKDDRIDHGEVIKLIKRVVGSRSARYVKLRTQLGGGFAVLKELLAGCSYQDGEVLDQALVRASESGNLSFMQLLLDKGARANGYGGRWFQYEPDEYQQNMTPLRAAVEKRNETAFRLLLNHASGVQPDDLEWSMSGGVVKVSEKTKTPLALAVRQTQQSTVELINDASVHRRDLHGTTPLLELLHQSSLVLHWRKTSQETWKSGGNILWDTHAMELLSLYGANISSNVIGNDGSTLYSYTKALISLRDASKWTFDGFVALEEHQIDDWLEIEIGHELDTCSKSVDLAQTLLAQGADIEAKDNRGMTLLWMAVSRDHLQLVDLLLSFGADTEASDSIYGRTPLWVAALLDFDDMIRKLLGKGAKTEVRCKQGKTPLCIAAEKGCRKSVKALVNSQADLHAKDSQGRTPIHLARENGHNIIERDLITALVRRRMGRDFTSVSSN